MSHTDKGSRQKCTFLCQYTKTHFKSQSISILFNVLVIYKYMVLGLFVKSEQLWDILPAIANHSAEINQHSEKIQVLESYHGKLNCM